MNPPPKNRPTLLPVDEETAVAPEPSTGSGTEAIRTLLGSRPEPVPRYQVGETLGRGGMGEVYAAYDARLRRTIALKSLRHADPGEQVVARFLREAQVTGQLEHPNVVPVYDIGLDATGRVFYTMKKVQGSSLAQLVRAGRAGRVARLRIFLQVCEAVAYAHARDVVHRDLKPANIMLGEFGEVLVLDWGIAKRVGETAERPVHSGAGDASLSDLTRADVVMGTPSWMSPEQARGEPAQPAADQYALGAILYFLLTGEPPFRPSGTVMDEVKTGTFRRPREVSTDVPRALEAVVLKAMSRDPKARYAAVTELRDDVVAWLDDRPVSALAYTLRDRAGRWALRHGRALVVTSAVIAGFAAVAVGAAALVGGIWSWSVTSARDAAVAQEKAATRQLAETRVALALVDVEAGRVPSALAKLDEAGAAWAGLGEADPPLLALARSYLAWREAPAPLAWTGADFVTADATADGREVFALDKTGHFWWLDAVTGRVIAEYQAEGMEAGTDASIVDGRPRLGWTAQTASGRTQRWATLTREGTLVDETVVPLGPARQDGDIASLSGDGTLGVVVAERVSLHAVPGGAWVGPGIDDVWVTSLSLQLDRAVGRKRAGGGYLRIASDIGVWDLRTGEQIWYQPTGAHGLLSRDGALLGLLDGDPQTLRMVDLATGAIRWQVPADQSDTLLFLPDGEHVVRLGEERARVHRLSDGAAGVWISTGSALGSHFSRAGRHTLAARSGRLEVRPWRLEQPDRALVQLPPTVGIGAVDLSSDGHLVAFPATDGHVRVIDADGGRVLRELVSNPCREGFALCGSRDVAFDASGGRLAVADRDGSLSVWDLATGATAWRRDAGLGIALSVDWVGDALVAVYEGGTLVSWDPATGAERARFGGELNSSWLVAIHPDGRRVLATGSTPVDPQFALWDLATGEQTVIPDQKGPCYGAALSPDGRQVAAGTWGGGVWLWDVDAVPMMGRLLIPADETVLSVAWTADGTTLLVGWMSGRVSVVDVARGVELVSLPLHQLGQQSAVQAIALRPDGRMFTAGGDGRLVAFELHPETEGPLEIALGDVLSPADQLRGARQAAAWSDWERALALFDAAAAGGEVVSAVARGRVLRELGRSDEIAREAVLAEGMSPEAFAVWSR